MTRGFAGSGASLLRHGAVVCAIAVVMFFLIRVIPGDVVDVLAAEGDLSDSEIAALRAELGLDRGVAAQFVAWLAAAAGSPRAARAAGQAMRRNPMPIVVPCHRVVGSGDWIGGYAGDARQSGPTLGIKRALLQLEARSSDVNSRAS